VAAPLDELDLTSRSLCAVGQVSVIGVPDSAGSYAAGQDQAPGALRAAGLIEALVARGLDVHDAGDLPTQVWKPDRVRPYAQNVELVTAGLQELARQLEPLLTAGDAVLVLGGNCTIALAVMEALGRLDQGTPGLAYLDRHFDLNTPETTNDGALDWMGLAHGLALKGSAEELVQAFGPGPLLNPGQLALLGVDANFATEWEREQALRLELRVGSSESLATDPTGSAAFALEGLPAGPLAVHIDVDVLDFIDAPLAENTDCRNTGPTLDQVGEALRPLVQDSRFRALSIGELNPTRSAGDPQAIPRFVEVLATTLDSA
jgi:arginase